MKKNQILVDISTIVLCDYKTGIQRVVRALVNELMKSDYIKYDIQTVFANTCDYGFKYTNYLNKFLTNHDHSTHEEGSPVELNDGDIFLGLDLCHQVTIAQENFFIECKLKNVKVWFVLYDLLPVKIPGCFPSLDWFHLHTRWLEIISNSYGILAISRTVACEFLDWYLLNISPRVSPPLIDYIKLGSDLKSTIPSQGFPEDWNESISKIKSKKTFLLVGTIEPRKSYQFVLNAFEKLWSSEYNFNLVIVGKYGWGCDDFINNLIKSNEYQNRLFWFNGISDECLEIIYKNSHCLIAASIGEGFGLPLIEALGYDLPVIARDIPIFHEVCGDSAFYFKGDEPIDLCNIITYWYSNFLNKSHPFPKSNVITTWKDTSDMLMQKITIL